MPHPFELSDSNFARLQARAIPLVDDLNSVIAKVLDLVEGDEPPTEAELRAPVTASRKFNPQTPPDLTHTKVIVGSFDDKTIDKPTWNALRDTAIRHAMKEAEGDPVELASLILARFVRGEKTDEGYRYLSDIGLSVQGQDAASAFKVAYHIASQTNVALKVQFIWRQKEAAAFPGVTGIMSVEPL